MKTAPFHCVFLFSLWFLAACGGASKGDSGKTDTADAAKGEKPEAADSADAGTPVTVTTVTNAPFNDSIELNAVSAFLQKSYVKANANGYLQSSDVYPGSRPTSTAISPSWTISPATTYRTANSSPLSAIEIALCSC
jgi:hypothetical protein